MRFVMKKDGGYITATTAASVWMAAGPTDDPNYANGVQVAV